MDRKFYLDLAASGACLPVGTDLVLKEHPDHHAILCNGNRLGAVLKEAAQRYQTPLALPVMDLALEKAALLSMLGVPVDHHDTYHFSECPTDQTMAMLRAHLTDPYDPRLGAQVDSIKWIVANSDLVPVGMTIGPFSLMTKLLADPITPLYIAASGVRADQDPEVQMIEHCLEMSLLIILRSLTAQIQAGAKMIFIAEPAANIAFLSPNQIEAGSDIFDRYVIKYNQRLRSVLKAADVDLFFHCCGELIPYMVKKFCELDPAVLSLGSSRKLWEDAAIVPRTTVLYGNLPSKKFYSEELAPVDSVRRQADELRAKMDASGHPFILGTECDILSVPGHEKTIMSKVLAMIETASRRRSAIQPPTSRLSQSPRDLAGVL